MHKDTVADQALLIWACFIYRGVLQAIPEFVYFRVKIGIRARYRTMPRTAPSRRLHSNEKWDGRFTATEWPRVLLAYLDQLLFISIGKCELATWPPNDKLGAFD